MIFLDYANYSQAAIGENFGAPEYSYWFVKKAFRHVIERVGQHIEVVKPEAEADQAFRAAQAKGESCALLAFCPPNTLPTVRMCPTVPVFAWEYDVLPNEPLNGDPREDWTHVLSGVGMAITHCRSAAASIQSAMGEAFPVWVIPAPVFDAFKSRRGVPAGRRAPFQLSLEGGFALDAGAVDLSTFRPERPRAEGVHALRVLDRMASEAARATQRLTLEGVIYSTVLNPYDGRKNWRDLVGAFVWAFRATPDAVLLIKLTRFDVEDGLMPVLQHLSTLGDFACRIVLVHGLLSNEAYSGLIDAASYAVNASYGEGQCLPLMEYMSAGRPAIAPAHTAMLDYVSSQNAFVVASQPELTHWPHDQRKAKRCLHHKVSFADLVRQFRESHRVAGEDPERYARMSAAAVEAMRAFCSDEVAEQRLAEVAQHVRRQASKGS